MGNICNVEPLQAQGTVVVDSAQSISSENPLQNKVVTVEKANASALCVDLTGNPITFNADSQAVQKLKVALEPIQDLHGYDKPWVGGANKNKFKAILSDYKTINTAGTWNGNSYAFKGITFTFNGADDNVTGIPITGTATATIAIVSSAYTIPTGNYIISGGVNGCTVRLCKNSDNTVIAQASTSEVSFSLAENTEVYTVLTVSNGNSPSGTLYPMIRNSSESATFAPYTNICPISGRTQTGVVSEGKNLFNVNGYNSLDPGVTVSNDQIKITTGNYRVARYQRQLTKGSYTISFKDSISSGNIFWAVTTSTSATISSGSVTDATFSTTFTITEDATYNFVIGSGNISGTVNITIYDIQIERGSTATAYEAYKTPASSEINFGQTVYGGHVDFKTGKVIVDKGYANFGLLNWNSTDIGYYTTDLAGLIKKPASDVVVISAISDRYEVVSRTALINSGAGSNKLGASQPGNIIVTSTTSPIGDFVYELATPIELQLTPAELELLEGYNYITADGNINISLVPENVIDYVMGQIISAMGTNESGRTTASRAYSAKEYFYKDGKMYKCLTSIASGATFTVGTNCAETSIFAELTALNA